MDFETAYYSSRMSVNEIADYLQLSIHTVKRYKKENKAPKSVIECLALIGGYCPRFSQRNDFSGWSFGQGFLWSPEGLCFTSGDIRAGRMAIEAQDLYWAQKINKVKDRSDSEGVADILPFPIKNQLFR